jgi:hypothetical protein
VALAAALGLKGDIDEAKAALAEFLNLRPGKTYSLAKLRALPINRNASPQYWALHEKTIDVGLRAAGMPEHD